MNWGALGGVLLVSLAVVVGTVGLFSLGIAAADRGGAVAGAGSALCFAGCAVLVGCGIYLVAVG
ncbi:hypothetical protein [Saccharothrix syringae]|uniref:Uncharacterized protein n=1 Tax=Saccharothrix syringae TaxID=103733 RepID=A0A5Q0GYQ2_SACSY|nr:hypothetical protein [Saccharothrix syringae]QFZ19177.1 hypothetical protein EKG83_18545 [Saccharothrix syringae]